MRLENYITFLWAQTNAKAAAERVKIEFKGNPEVSFSAPHAHTIVHHATHSQPMQSFRVPRLPSVQLSTT